MCVHVSTSLFIKSDFLDSLATLNLIFQRSGGSYGYYENSNWERPSCQWEKTLVLAWLIQAHKADRPQDIKTTVLDPITGSSKPQAIMDGRKNISNMATIEHLYPLVYPSGTADGERAFVYSTLFWKRVVWPEIWSCLSCARTGSVRKLGHTLPLKWWRCRGEFGCWIWIWVCYWWREMKDLIQRLLRNVFISICVVFWS